MKLLNYFLTNTKKLIHKPESYFDIYERYFNSFASAMDEFCIFISGNKKHIHG